MFASYISDITCICVYSFYLLNYQHKKCALFFVILICKKPHWIFRKIYNIFISFSWNKYQQNNADQCKRDHFPPRSIQIFQLFFSACCSYYLRSSGKLSTTWMFIDGFPKPYKCQIRFSRKHSRYKIFRLY